MLCVLCFVEFQQHVYVILCHVMLSAHVALGVLSLTPMSQWQYESTGEDTLAVAVANAFAIACAKFSGNL